LEILLRINRLLLSTLLFVLLSTSFLLCVSSDDSMWNQTYGGANDDFGGCVVETSDGGYAVAGYTDSFGVGNYDFYIIKTDEFGVVPEAAWVILPLLLVATATIFVSKKKLLRQ